MDENQSLFGREEKELSETPPLFEMDEWRTLEKGGEFTGERLFAQRPRVYEMVCQALAEGMGIRQIARACSVSPNTIYAVMKREGITIETLKTKTLSNLRLAATVGSERMLEMMTSGNMKASELGISLGVTIDKMLLLSGQATQRIETLTREEIGKKYVELIDNLPVLDADITGIAGEDLPQSGAGAGGRAGADARACAGENLITDSQFSNSEMGIDSQLSLMDSGVADLQSAASLGELANVTAYVTAEGVSVAGLDGAGPEIEGRSDGATGEQERSQAGGGGGHASPGGVADRDRLDVDGILTKETGNDE